uniref:Uncharacterized protein n=1 Tax=Anopheles atroparvus TaxID=41427 RepID=A0A182IWK7_ANOAO
MATMWFEPSTWEPLGIIRSGVTISESAVGSEGMDGENSIQLPANTRPESTDTRERREQPKSEINELPFPTATKPMDSSSIEGRKKLEALEWLRSWSFGGSGLPQSDEAHDVDERIESESDRLRIGDICTCFSICKGKRTKFRTPVVRKLPGTAIEPFIHRLARLSQSGSLQYYQICRGR